MTEPVRISEIMPKPDLVPVTGEFVMASAERIVLRRGDPRAGTVHVHFPRFGFQINKPS